MKYCYDIITHNWFVSLNIKRYDGKLMIIFDAMGEAECGWWGTWKKTKAESGDCEFIQEASRVLCKSNRLTTPLLLFLFIAGNHIESHKCSDACHKNMLKRMSRSLCPSIASNRPEKRWIGWITQCSHGDCEFSWAQEWAFLWNWIFFYGQFFSPPDRPRDKLNAK